MQSISETALCLLTIFFCQWYWFALFRKRPPHIYRPLPWWTCSVREVNTIGSISPLELNENSPIRIRQPLLKLLLLALGYSPFIIRRLSARLAAAFSAETANSLFSLPGKKLRTVLQYLWGEVYRSPCEYRYQLRECYRCQLRKCYRCQLRECYRCQLRECYHTVIEGIQNSCKNHHLNRAIQYTANTPSSHYGHSPQQNSPSLFMKSAAPCVG